jgi:hypothetical protein
MELALRIEGDRVPVNEVADLLSGPAAARENFSAAMIEYRHLFVVVVPDVQNLRFDCEDWFEPAKRRNGDFAWTWG